MTWTLLGWIFIGLGAVILLVLGWIIKLKGYPPRRMPAIQYLQGSRVAAIERGRHQQIVLGHQLWSRVYPGLGLFALSVLPSLLDPENLVNGDQAVSTSDGSVVVFAQQIIQGRYQEGFSTSLHESSVRAALPGPTPLSFTAGLLADVQAHPHGSLALFGDYGPEAALWAMSAARRGGQVFAAAGSIASQAVLYLELRDLLLGEEVFMVPGLLAPTSLNLAGLLTEDILRIGLILLLIAGVILTLVGVV